MRLSFSMSTRQELRLELDIAGGVTESVFPILQRRLERSRKLQRVLCDMADPEEYGQERFRSYIDFLLCAVFPEVAARAFAFYRGEGLLLKEQVTEYCLFSMEIHLLGAVEAICIAHDKHLDINWIWVRKVIEVLSAELPMVHVYDHRPTPLEQLAEAAE